ncbi:hypothetical protein, partial [Saccharibacillus sacchari]
MKKIKRENGVNRAISVPAFVFCTLLAVMFLIAALNSTFFPMKVLVSILCVLSTISSVLFLAITYYKNNIFFNVILIALIHPMIWLFSLLINFFYMVLVPLSILVLMIIVAFLLYLAIGVSLLQVGIDGH